MTKVAATELRIGISDLLDGVVTASEL